MIRAGSCTSADCIYQILTFPSILHFTVRLCVQGHSCTRRQTHSRPPSISYTESTADTDALDQVSVNSFPVFLSAAQCSHGCIKSDEYECRFDFSTHLYLLAESCAQPSAVPIFCLSPRMCLIGFTDGPATCWSVVLFRLSAAVSAGAAEAYCMCPDLSSDLSLFGKFHCVSKC